MTDSFFRRFLGRSKADTHSRHGERATELDSPQLSGAGDAGSASVDESVALVPDLRVDIGLLSDVGCVREVNEDSIRVLRPTEPGELAQCGILLVVADGMGGHNAGEIASQLAVEAVVRCHADDPNAPGLSLAQAVKIANHIIVEAATTEAYYKGMGTTCTALLLRGGLAYCAHVGDSRLYLMRSNDIFLMTEDHSALMDLVRRGTMTHDEARHHPQRNVIVRALGARPDVEVASWEKPLAVRAGDAFLLCTDGLYDLVEDEELRDAMRGAPLQVACERLVELARQRGGPDNITVAVVAISA